MAKKRGKSGQQRRRVGTPGRQPPSPAAEPAPANPTGRPLTLTPDVQALICQAICEGNYREVAAGFVGVPLRTFHRWCARGRADESGPYFELWQAVLEAERTAEIKMVEAVFKAAAADPRHAQWWLERKFPQRWGANRGELAKLLKQVIALTGQGQQGAKSPGATQPTHPPGDPGQGTAERRRAVK